MWLSACARKFSARTQLSNKVPFVDTLTFVGYCAANKLSNSQYFARRNVQRSANCKIVITGKIGVPLEFWGIKKCDNGAFENLDTLDSKFLLNYTHDCDALSYSLWPPLRCPTLKNGNRLSLTISEAEKNCPPKTHTISVGVRKEQNGLTESVHATDWNSEKAITQ